MSREELEEIVQSYKWIKVSQYREADLRNPEVEWKLEYKDLARHHQKETTFLIEKCRELAKHILENGFI